jgi:tetratricopeptide (TPR) repeat protein
MKASRQHRRRASASAPADPARANRRRIFLVRVAIVGLIAAVVGGGTFAWRLWRQRQSTPIVRAAVPPVPALKSFPHLFEDRVRLTSAAALQPFQPLEALEELAQLYHANGFAREAEQVERGLRILEPKDPRWPYYLAELRLTAGDSGAAENFLNETLRLAPDSAPVELKLGDLLFRLGRAPEAAAHYRRRLALLPNDPYAQLGLARISLQAGDWNEAKGMLEALVRSAPTFSTAHNLLAEIYAHNGDEKSAQEHRLLSMHAGRFREADDPWLLALREWSYDSYHLEVLGEKSQQAGKLERSLPLYEQAVRVGGGDGEAYAALGNLYKMLNRWDDARITLERGVAISPRTESLYFSLGEVLRKQGRGTDAVALLQRGVQLLPNSAEMRNDLGMALEEAGREAEAIAAYQAAIQLNPDYPEAHYNLGLRLRAAGRVEEAAPHFKRMLESRPSDSKTLLILAQDEIRAGRLESAATYLDALEKFHPDLPDTHRLRGNWHQRRGMAASAAGQADLAEQEFRAGLAASPDAPLLHVNLGVLLAQKGNHPEAVAQFERFLALAPQDLSGYLYLAQSLLPLNRFAEARAALEKGIALARSPGASNNAHTHEVIDRLDQLRREMEAAAPR